MGLALMNAPHITMVKKIMADGSPCKKCAEVEQRLRDGGYLEFIDHVAIADERDDASEGMQLANRWHIERAPFFIIEEAGREPRVYTVFMRFLKEVLQAEVNEKDEGREILERNNLDFL